MLFTASTFLFLFLPIVILGHFIALYFLKSVKISNLFLLAASLLFYAWDEVFYIGIMIVSIIINYFVGILLCKFSKKRVILAIGITLNLAMLFSFKYAHFAVDNINTFLSFFKIATIDLAPIHLPLGISFFTFQAISYIIDVYRKEANTQNSVIKLALYISLFPQVIAGPIVRYNTIEKELSSRILDVSKFYDGIKLFIIGLSKKMLIANTVAEVADTIFSLDSTYLNPEIAWIALFAYALQIYYDFSGYTDMATGLGKMFGFTFPQNFNHPYIATSIRDFWKRWHMSLSTWLRDYLYIPLGGSRKGSRRTQVNLLIVFVLCGFWHGASWHFIIWGLWYGVFLILERGKFGKLLERSNIIIQHVYSILVILLGWVFFRCETLTDSMNYLKALFGLISNHHHMISDPMAYINNWFLLMFALGIILATPISRELNQKIINNIQTNAQCVIYEMVIIAGGSVMFLYSLASVASSTYNPFIYFRF